MRTASSLAVLLLMLPSVLAAVLAAAPLAGASYPDDSNVVVAVVDTGINPYHRTFRDAARTAHPSTYISGFPATAPSLNLCLDAVGIPGCSTLGGALQRDGATWNGVQRGKLYTVPGTRIIGAVSVGHPSDGFTGNTRIFDDVGHGTATASLVAGKDLGACQRCLLVVVEGPGDEALQWALAQPWIDVISNSWGLVGNLDYPPPPFGTDGAGLTRELVLQGKTVVFSAGNGLGTSAAEPVTSTPDYLVPGESTYTSRYTGPDWVVTVGAVDPENGQPVAGSGRPVDVVASGIGVPAASASSRIGEVDFSGTSAAAPIVAGAFGEALLQVRQTLGDSREGPRTTWAAREVVAQGSAPPGLIPGAAAGDGLVTRDELQRAVFHTAHACATSAGHDCPGDAEADWPFPVRTWGWTLPAPPMAYPAMVGYGLLNAASATSGARVVLGALPMPDRSEADSWATSDSLVRQRLWGFWEHGAKPSDAVHGG